MSIKENKELIRQGIKELNEIGGDLTKVRSIFEKYFAPNFIYHIASREDMNLEQSIQYTVGTMSAFPDATFAIDDMVAEGDKVAIRGTLQGIHGRTYMGIPATGKHIVIKVAEIYKIEGRKVVEKWYFPDSLGLMTQLGVIPSIK